MIHNVTVPFTKEGVGTLISLIGEYRNWLEVRAEMLTVELASRGWMNAQVRFNQALAAGLYIGVKDCSVHAEEISPTEYKVVANGRAVLFIEFGAGVTYSTPQHEEAALNGMGVGTYPGQTHAFDPEGWVLPKNSVAPGQKTLGNPAYAPMYETMKSLQQELDSIVQEVFRD